MMLRITQSKGRRFSVVIALLLLLQTGCAQIRLPAIDPTGNRIFLPPGNSTTLLPNCPLTNPLRRGNLARNGLGPAPPSVSFPESAVQIPSNNPPAAPAVVAGPTIRSADPTTPRYPVQPKFKHAPDAPDCNLRLCKHTNKKYVIPNPKGLKSRGQKGEILLTPHRIIAPVGSEVAVLAGICGGDGYFVMNQPLEWMLSNDSVGQFIEVGGMQHSAFNRLIPPRAQKFDGQYAWGRTGLKEVLLTRGTPAPVDDIQLLKGQTFASISSESSGTTYLTAVAPKAEAWDKRRASTIIHWVDGIWSIPTPTLATSGTVHPMTTLVTKSTTGDGLPGWKVRYTIVGGAPAEFAPTGGQSVEATSDRNGQATVQLRQPAGQFDPGTTQVRVDVIRPEVYGEPELVVESGVTSVTWSAPALTLRAIGPKTAGVNEPYNYRIEVSNPGDQVSRGVVVRTKDLGNNVEFISSTPKPTEYGNQFQWDLGDVQPGAPPKTIDIQLKSETRGNVALCFEVESQTDGLLTDACAQTEISVPCLGLTMEGPETAIVGQEIDYVITIENQCDEPLENIELLVQYDPVLQARSANSGPLGNPIRYPIERLAYGERRNVPLTFTASAPGVHCFDLSIKADGGHTARAKECVDVSQAQQTSATLSLEGTPQTEVGGKALVRATIKNNGNQRIDDIRLTNSYSDSLRFYTSSRAYADYVIGSDRGFTVGSLEPGEEAVVEVVYDAILTDGNAVSTMSISNPQETVAAVEKFDIRIEPRGTGVAPDLGLDDPLPSGNEGQINIPQDPDGFGGGATAPGTDDAANSQRGLEVFIRTREPQINVGQQTTIDFVIRNRPQTADQQVAIRLLVPTGLSVVQMITERAGLPVRETSPDQTEYYFEQRAEIRPNEQLEFSAIVEATQPGTFQVEAAVLSAFERVPVTNQTVVDVR